jgi:SET domain-containing protein
MKIADQFASFPLRVGPSRIDRRGVFAEKNIPPRRKVVEYAGEKITIYQALRRIEKVFKRKGPKRLYIAKLNRRWALDGGVGGSGAEYINHCCDPNLFVRKTNGRIHFYSRRRIRKGQELTLDYSFGPTENRLPCHCGSPKCRGTINRLK